MKGEADAAVSLSNWLLGLVEDAFAKEIEASATVHLSLDELQSVDLTFHHSVAPRQPESRKQRIFVALQALGEGGQRRSAGSFDPLIPCICVAIPEQVEQRLRNLRDGRQLW